MPTSASSLSLAARGTRNVARRIGVSGRRVHPAGSVHARRRSAFGADAGMAAGAGAPDAATAGVSAAFRLSGSGAGRPHATNRGSIKQRDGRARRADFMGPAFLPRRLAHVETGRLLNALSDSG